MAALPRIAVIYAGAANVGFPPILTGDSVGAVAIDHVQRTAARSAEPTSVRTAATVCFPPMLLKKSVLQCGKSFDSLNSEGMGGF